MYKRQIWTRINNHARVTSYHDIPASKFDDVVAFIRSAWLLRAIETVEVSKNKHEFDNAMLLIARERLEILQRLRTEAAKVDKEAEKLRIARKELEEKIQDATDSLGEPLVETTLGAKILNPDLYWNLRGTRTDNLINGLNDYRLTSVGLGM